MNFSRPLFERIMQQEIDSIDDMFIGILFILNVGNFVRVGFDQIYLLQKPSIMSISEILDTYIVKMGIKQGYFSYATAVQLFQSTFSLLLVVLTNKISKKVTGVSLW